MKISERKKPFNIMLNELLEKYKDTEIHMHRQEKNGKRETWQEEKKSTQ